MVRRAVTPFLITGLPRSRTAWLSVAATSAEAICHHEPGYGDLDSARRIWSGDGRYRLVGIADAGLGLHLAGILAEFAPRTLIVERPAGEVIASSRAYLGRSAGPGWDEAMAEQMAALQSALAIDHPLIRRVAYADLHRIEVVRGALAWLGVADPLNLEQLMHFNVQSSLAHNLAKLSAWRAEQEAA